MIRMFFSLILLVTFFVQPATLQAQTEQSNVWIQIEAQPSLTLTTDRARIYAGNLPDVSAFSLGGGWYAVALGPYTETEAKAALARYRVQGRVPGDSFIAFPSSFRQQIWPIGANALDPAAQSAPTPAPAPEQPETIAVADETPREARASEARLSRDDKKQLQAMLQWAGFYNSSIDGAFGRGTRRSMAAWQEANGFEATGILTTRQRQVLKDQYNAVLAGLDLQQLRVPDAGIEMLMPMGAFAFDRYETPFVHYKSTGLVPDAKLVLISQAGDKDSLYGLYDILQTLDIVPLDGPRKRTANAFEITGANSRIVTQVRANLRDGEIKGFILVWPKGDETRRTRLLSEIRANFKRIEGVLPQTAGLDVDQNIDLVSGLAIRKPRLSRSGFYLDATGSVMTTLAATQNCGRITLDGDFDAQITAQNSELGLAILQPDTPLAPSKHALFSTSVPRLKSDIAVAGYSFEGALSGPTLTLGTLSAIRGLQGQNTLNRLEIDTLQGDEGGPVMDKTGALIGALIPVETANKTLPHDVAFAVNAPAMAQMMKDANVKISASRETQSLATEDLLDLATQMTVLVSCWD